MNQKFVLGLLILSSIFTFSFGQVQPDKTQQTALQELSTKYNSGVNVTWDERNGSPEIISFTTPISFDKNQENSAKIFLKEITNLIKHRSKKDTLVITKYNENKGVKHFRFQQKYEGIPVKGGEYVVTVLNDGKIQTALGSFYKDISVDPKPSISPEEALKIALNNQPKGTALKDSLNSYKLIIIPQNGDYFLAYELHIKVKDNDETWSYIINAVNGKVFKKNNNVDHSYAYVYLRHPGIDATYSQISPLSNLNNNGYLQGTYANIVNDKSDRAYNASNDFRYSTSDTHFDEANLYYHVDRIATYFHNLGFNSFTQITAHTHHDFYDDGEPTPNAGYDRYDHHLKFSDGQGVTGYNSFAREDKVIYHEYTHAVADYEAGLSSDYTQFGAIHEGLADYYAASFTGRTTICEYALAGYDETWRNLSNPRIANYSQYITNSYYIIEGEDWGLYNPHLGGELWSACLWDLRSSLTSTVADEIIYDALSAIPSNVTFQQYRQAIIDKDISNNNGCNVNTIKHIFYQRGIGSDARSVTLSGTLTNTETWYCTNTLQGNVFVPSGVTLYIPSYATVNLNNYSIFTTGGTISVNVESLNGLRAKLEVNTFLRGLCGSIQAAATYANNGNEIILANGNFNENVSISNKSDLTIMGSSPNYDHFGTLTLTNCDYFYGYYFGAKNVYLNQTDYAMINYINAYGTNQTTIGFYLYNSDATANNLVADYSQAGISCYDGAEADIDESWLSNNLRGIDSYNGSNVIVEGTYFCGTALDLKAYNFSSIYATSCYFDGGIPSVSQSSSTIQTSGNQNCPLSKIISSRQFDNNNYIISADGVGIENSEFEEINSAYFSINKKLKKDHKSKTAYNKESYCRDYERVIEDYKKFITKNPNSPLARIALIAIVHSSRRIDDLRGKKDAVEMKNYLVDVIENKEYSALEQTAERLMIDYYTLVNDFNGAIKTIDELIEKYREDKDYVCDIMYAKGLILAYDLNQPENAKECFSSVVNNYPNNPLVGSAQNELRILGKQVEADDAKKLTKTENSQLDVNNYPNPFNPTTKISFRLPQSSKVSLKVYDMLGREVANLADEVFEAGTYEREFDASNLASGIYFYTIKTTLGTISKKMLLVK